MIRFNILKLPLNGNQYNIILHCIIWFLCLLYTFNNKTIFCTDSCQFLLLTPIYYTIFVWWFYASVIYQCLSTVSSSISLFVCWIKSVNMFILFYLSLKQIRFLTSITFRNCIFYFLYFVVITLMFPTIFICITNNLIWNFKSS